MIATLNPSKPVVDKFVLANFGLRLPYYYQDDRTRMTKTIELYDQLCSKYDELLRTLLGKRICEKFDKIYSSTDITDTKKVDLVLWQVRT
jgi:hypothetical protein